MAEIPVKKSSSGIPWWVWLLGAIVILGLLWWLFASNDDEAEIAEADTEYSTEMAGGDIMVDDGMTTDMLAIGSSIDVGQVEVTELAGDMAFWADVDGERTFVVFDQEQTPSDMTEGEFDINPGTMLSMAGRVFAATDALPDTIDAQVPATVDRYVVADTITMATPSN